MRLTGADAHKIINVLRLRTGDAIELIDSAAQVFPAEITANEGAVEAVLGDATEHSAEPRLRITLAQGLPKGQKMDYVVEKATELGVVGVIPFVSERTIGEERGTAKIERWRRLARTAAQQSGRARVPAIEESVRWSALIQRFSAFDLTLMPWELAEREPLRAVLPRALAGVREVLVVIGPEGGFSHEEARAAIAAGARAVSLGSRIFRTETAGLVTCAALLYENGDV